MIPLDEAGLLWGDSKEAIFRNIEELCEVHSGIAARLETELPRLENAGEILSELVCAAINGKKSLWNVLRVGEDGF